MTEAGWLGSAEPRLMLEAIEGEASDRKLRLFICACCRAIWPLMSERSWREAVEIAERYADGVGSKGQMDELRDAIWYAEYNRHQPPLPAHQPSDAVQLALRPRPFYPACDVPKILKAASSDPDLPVALLRDIFGNPFHPITPSSSWITSSVLALARRMYDSRDFSAMPILADALQDSGCDNTDILDHCRGPGPHVRGCWVVDAILNK